MKFLGKLLLVIFLVQLGAYFLPARDPNKAWGDADKFEFNKEGKKVTLCPDGYGYKIPKREENSGLYIACEDFDAYYQAMETGDLRLAEKFLLIKRR